MPRSLALLGLSVVAFGACSGEREGAFLTQSPTQPSTEASDAGSSTSFVEVPTPTTSTASCVTARAAAALSPVNLVFMFDQSGSMGDELFARANPAERWYPITNGLKSFFADAASAGIRASLQYFPAETSSRLVAPSCDIARYETPEVALTPLPNASSFAASLNAHAPLGGTPTLPAITGAAQYAKKLEAQYPGERAAVVLVTDGEPSDCGSFDEVKARLAADAAQIETYVVGVGTDLVVLDELANAGGTGSAILVDLASPQKAAADFLAALDAIRVKTLSCSIPIAQALGDGDFDPGRVNVALSSSSETNVLEYDATCKSGEGWRYDDVIAPQAIELCSNSCERARRLPEGALEVQLGCATKGLK